jgi:hypothetical protein
MPQPASPGYKAREHPWLLCFSNDLKIFDERAEFGHLFALRCCVKQLNKNWRHHNGYGEEISRQQEDRTGKQGQLHEVQD